MISDDEKNQNVALEDKKEERNAFQKVLEIPLIGEYIGIFIGCVPPVLLEMVINYLAFGTASIKGIGFIFLVLFFVWNLALFLLFGIMTKTPILPIPLFVVAFLILVVETVGYFFS